LSRSAAEFRKVLEVNLTGAYIVAAAQRHLTGNVIFADDGYNIEGHSWPEANEALYADRLEELLAGLDETYPRKKG
jgi:hypothetical protein